MADTNGQVQSVERAFAIMEMIAKSSSGLSIKQITDGLKLPKSTVHRLLQTLVQLGYVFQEKSDAEYRVTMRLLELAHRQTSGMDIVTFARPHLDQLAAQCGSTVHLVLPDGCDGVYVYKTVLETTGIQLSSRVGLRVPLYRTAAGKAMMSTMSRQAVQQIWQSSTIDAVTPKTIVRLDELELQLMEIQRNGWAFDDEENESGVRCVAVPLTTATESAAFSISCLAVQMDHKRTLEIANLCLETQKHILHDMGIRPRRI